MSRVLRDLRKLENFYPLWKSSEQRSQGSHESENFRSLLKMQWAEFSGISENWKIFITSGNQVSRVLRVLINLKTLGPLGKSSEQSSQGSHEVENFRSLLKIQWAEFAGISGNWKIFIPSENLVSRDLRVLIKLKTLGLFWKSSEQSSQGSQKIEKFSSPLKI